VEQQMKRGRSVLRSKGGSNVDSDDSENEEEEKSAKEASTVPVTALDGTVSAMFSHLPFWKTTV
jgi:hypothetical protein